MLWLVVLSGSLLSLALAAALFEIMRLRRHDREILSREATVEAQKALSGERTALTEARIKQAFDEGVLEGLKRVSTDHKEMQNDSYRLGHEKGLLEGERNAEQHFKVEYWTEIKKNQGYFFTTAEIVACYQLMYKGIPLGLPQRHVLEKSETVDRVAVGQMVDQLLGQQVLGPAAGAIPNIRVVNRADAPKALLSSTGDKK